MQELQTRNVTRGELLKEQILFFVFIDAESFSKNKVKYPQQMGTGWFDVNHKTTCKKHKNFRNQMFRFVLEGIFWFNVEVVIIFV